MFRWTRECCLRETEDEHAGAKAIDEGTHAAAAARAIEMEVFIIIAIFKKRISTPKRLWQRSTALRMSMDRCLSEKISEIDRAS
jgi:hypothetical protein